MEQSTDIWLLDGKLFPLLFTMMAPIGLIPAFFALTAKMDEADRRAMANRDVLGDQSKPVFRRRRLTRNFGCGHR